MVTAKVTRDSYGDTRVLNLESSLSRKNTYNVGLLDYGKNHNHDYFD